MDAIEFLLQQHARNHSAKVARWEGTNAAGLNSEDTILQDVSEDKIRKVPQAGLNSIAWVLWHIARSEDVGTSLVGGGRPQVWHEGGWAKRLKYERTDFGTGMTVEEVADLSKRIDIPALREYRWAVGRRTREIAQGIKPEQLTEKVDLALVRKALAAGFYGPKADAAQTEKNWSTRSKGYALSTYGVSHNIGHWGEITTLKSLL
ncbi:MAG: DinB family protein [Chloroflexi bacterium]|nr:DinB family protein [Chloroflexota bacterium]